MVQRGYESQFFLWPTADQPEPWSQVSKGGLPASNNWARATLISGNHRDSENAVRDAIARDKMQPVLDAINYLAATPFIINGPVLDFMLRREEPRIQKLAADVAELERERELRELKWHERQKLANLRAELSIWSLDTAVANAMGRFHVPLQMDSVGVSIRCRFSISPVRIVFAGCSYLQWRADWRGRLALSQEPRRRLR